MSTRSRAAALISAAARESVKTLMNLQEAGQSPAVRLGAARAILELGGKLREAVVLEQRVRVLEQQFGNQQNYAGD